MASGFCPVDMDHEIASYHFLDAIFFLVCSTQEICLFLDFTKRLYHHAPSIENSFIKPLIFIIQSDPCHKKEGGAEKPRLLPGDYFVCSTIKSLSSMP